jgi:protein-tyrosine-phosphatase
MTHSDPFDSDQRFALACVAATLVPEFDGLVDPGAVGRFVASSYDRLEGQGAVDDTLPLVQRFARQQLEARARLAGTIHGGIPVVLFLCVHNAGRSQMALGWFNHLTGGRAVAWSGGSDPGTAVNPAAVAAMAEVDIDIAGEFPKPWTDEILHAADVVVTMGCGDVLPFVPGKRYEDWPLHDPHGQAIDAVRPIRDEIEQRVRELLSELNIPTA